MSYALISQDGAPRRIRTADLLFTKQLLYRLSYWGIPDDPLNTRKPQIKPGKGDYFDQRRPWEYQLRRRLE